MILETALKRLYEGMFLVDSALAAQDWQVILDEVQRILDRAEAVEVSEETASPAPATPAASASVGEASPTAYCT